MLHYCFNAFLLDFVCHKEDFFFRFSLKSLLVIWIMIVIYSQCKSLSILTNFCLENISYIIEKTFLLGRNIYILLIAFHFFSLNQFDE